MEEQIRDTRSILRHGKHISELEKERDFYLSELNEYSQKLLEIQEKIKLIKMSPVQQKRYHIQKKKNRVLVFSIFGISFYNLIICFFIDYNIKIYFSLLVLNVLFMYLSMMNFNNSENIQTNFLVYSEKEYQDLKNEYISNEHKYEFALMECEDIERKLKKLGVE